MSRPTVFVGSSSEGLVFAREIANQLRDVAEVTVWDEGVFTPGNTYLETLTLSTQRFDFGIFLFTADDSVTSRGHEGVGPRDNVLFELGLFMGRIGRTRGFGTWAAIRYAISSEFLQSPIVNGDDPLECLIETDVVRGIPQSIRPVILRKLQPHLMQPEN